MQEILIGLRDMFCFSVPESMFVTIMTYILMKRFDLLDIHRLLFSLKNVLIPAIISSFILSLSGYLNIGGIGKLISLLVFFLIMNLTIRKNSFQIVHRFNLKLLICFLLSIFMAILMESITLIILMLILKIDVHKLFTDESQFYIRLFTSFIWIIIEMCIITIFLIKKENSFIEIVSILLKNKVLLMVIFLMVIIILGIIMEFIKLVLYNSIFFNTDLIEQIFITLGIIVILPILGFVLIFFVISFLRKQELLYQQLYHS